MNTYRIEAPILGCARGQVVTESELDGVDPTTLENFINSGLVVAVQLDVATEEAPTDQDAEVPTDATEEVPTE